MSLLHKQNQQEVVIDRPLPEVFLAFEKAGGLVGTVEQASKTTGTMKVKTGMSLFPIRNSATVRVAFEEAASSKTRVRFHSEALDGVIGTGAAGAAMDNLTAMADAILTGRPPEMRSAKATALLIGAIVAALAFAWAMFSIGS